MAQTPTTLSVRFATGIRSWIAHKSKQFVPPSTESSRNWTNFKKALPTNRLSPAALNPHLSANPTGQPYRMSRICNPQPQASTSQHRTPAVPHSCLPPPTAQFTLINRPPSSATPAPTSPSAQSASPPTPNPTKSTPSGKPSPYNPVNSPTGN